LSHRQAGERFGVSAASVSRCRALEREQGEACARFQGGDRRSGWVEAHKDTILALIEETPDVAIEELHRAFADKGVTVAYGTIRRFSSVTPSRPKKDRARGRAGPWAKMEPHCLGKPTDSERSGGDNRLFVEGILWIVRTGSPWRDLPEVFGKWNMVFKRYRDWVKAGVFARLFEACSDEPDMEYAMIDATIIKVHRHGQGAKGGTQSQAIGRSKGGLTTKIVALTDGHGNLVRFVLLPGHRYDTIGVPPLIEGLIYYTNGHEG
jgi:transposase